MHDQSQRTEGKPIMVEDGFEQIWLLEAIQGPLGSDRVQPSSEWRDRHSEPTASFNSRLRESGRDLPRIESESETTLSRYLRDLAAHQVMDPEEELAAAQAVERTEVEHWVALLSWLPAAGPVLDQLTTDIESLVEDARPNVPQIEELRELIHAEETELDEVPRHQRRWNELSRALARTIRLPDRDRQWVANANAVAQDLLHKVPDISERADFNRSVHQNYLRRVRGTDLAQQRAKQRFVEANLRLVVIIARRYTRGSLPLVDIIQEGNIGLIKAVQRFDHRRGYRFSTFASWWIRHAVSLAVADRGRVVRIPVHMLAAHHRASRATETVETRTGSAPTNDELEQRTHIPVKKLERLKCIRLGTQLSLDRELGDEAGRSYLDLLADDDTPGPDECLTQKLQASAVQEILEILTSSESRFIRWRFGLDDEDELTLREIGERCKMSREGVRRRLEKTLGKLRKQLGKS